MSDKSSKATVVRPDVCGASGGHSKTAAGDHRKVLCASAGELNFAVNISSPDRGVIREMWTNRLAGFHRRDLEQYLRDSTDSTQHLINGREYSFRTFRRICSVLLPLQRVAWVFDVAITAEVLDAHVVRDADRFVTSSYAVLMLGGRIARQDRLTMTVALEGERFRWDRIVVEKIPRRFWCYRRTRYGNGWEKFVVRERRRAACPAEH